MSKANLSRNQGQKKITGQLDIVIRLLVADGSIGYMILEKPRSRLQRYRLKEQGRTPVEGIATGMGKHESKANCTDRD